jgi:hypothetical protein
VLVYFEGFYNCSAQFNLYFIETNNMGDKFDKSIRLLIKEHLKKANKKFEGFSEKKLRLYDIDAVLSAFLSCSNCECDV